MSRAAPIERLCCDACGMAQPADRRAADACVACGGAVRPEARCPWCLAFGPRVRFCRDCGAELPPPEHFGAARMLKAGGVDRFAIAERLRGMPGDYVADLGRRFDVRWGAARAVLERLAHLAAYGEHAAAVVEAATGRWLATLPLEGPEPAATPPAALPPPPRDPFALRGPERDAAIEAVRAARAGCDDPDVRAAAAVASVRLAALDPDAFRDLAAGAGAGPLADDWALAATRLWLLPAHFPRFDIYFDVAVSRWKSGAARGLAERGAALLDSPSPRVAALAAVGRFALGDEAARVRAAAERALAGADPELRALAALALAHTREPLPAPVVAALAELAAAGPGPAALAAVDCLLTAGAPPPEARACVQACLEDADPALVMEGLQRLRHRRDPPGGFGPTLVRLLDRERPEFVRVAAASALAAAPDPSEAELRALVDLAATDPDEDLAREAARAAGEHAGGRPWIVTSLFELLGRPCPGAGGYLESRLADWAREGTLPVAELVAAFGEPDPERRRKVLRLGRAAARAGEPQLLPAALGAFLAETDPECRDTAIWICRDCWREDRERERGPLDAVTMAQAAGDLATFWRRVGARLASGDARDCAVGEHLQWIAAQAAPETLAPFAEDLAAGRALIEALGVAAADRAVRLYPRNQFVQLAGRIAAAAPALGPAVHAALDALAPADEPYDLRYWVERVRKELDGQPI